MELFQLTKDIFRKFGLIPTEFLFRNPFNKRAISLLFLQLISITSYTLNLILEANTFTQYSDTAFMLSATVVAFYIYVICIWYRKIYLTRMNSLEIVVNQSEFAKNEFKNDDLIKKKNSNVLLTGLANPTSKVIYVKFNKYAETFCKLFYIGLVKVAPIGSMLPLLIISYVSYFTTDSGSDAFILPFPMW